MKLHGDTTGEGVGVGSDDIARFERVFSVGAAELTPATIPVVRDTIGLGNYAQVLSDTVPDGGVEEGLSGLIAERDEAIDAVVAGMLPVLIPRVVQRWDAILPEDRVRSGGGASRTTQHAV